MFHGISSRAVRMHSSTAVADPFQSPPPANIVFLTQAAEHYVGMLCSSERPDLFVSMNEQTIKNLSIGIYDGCKVAVELAAELAKL